MGGKALHQNYVKTTSLRKLTPRAHHGHTTVSGKYPVDECSPLGYAVSGFASWTSVRFTRSTFRRYSLRSASILCHSPLSAR